MNRSLSILLVFMLPAAMIGQSSVRPDLYGYVEPYFCYDFNQPSNHTRAGHIYSYNKHNEVNLNLGMIGVHFTDSTFRSNIAMMAGTYAAANLSNERPLFQHIFEANAGFRIGKKNNVWLDAGIMPSHIGFESAIGSSCATLSRSILADNTPYFETGIKLSGTSKNERWNFALFLLNGWQRIEQRNGNSMPSAGTQITYNANDKLVINSSTFIGTDEPDSTRKCRYFHNLYAIWNPNDKLQFTAGFDIGMQQQYKGSESYQLWHSAVLISRYQFTPATSVSVRGEYYHDPDHIIVSTGGNNEFSVWGYSANLDYQINERIMWRVEFRSLNASKDIYLSKGGATSMNNSICGTIAVLISND